MEIAERGTCHCALFGRAELTVAAWKVAEAELVEDYHGVPLRPNGGVLDTGSVERDPLRGLPVPDALAR